MGVNIFWDNEEQTILRFICEPQWTLDDLRAARLQGDEMATSVHHNVGMILDAPTTIPAEVRHYNFTGFTKTSSQVQVMVVIANRPILRALFSLIIKVSPDAALVIRLAKDLNEARTIVKTHLGQPR